MPVDGGLSSLRLHCADLAACAYPLYAATEQLWADTPGATLTEGVPAQLAATPLTLLTLGSFSHTQQIASLDAAAPFLLLTLAHAH